MATAVAPETNGTEPVGPLGRLDWLDETHIIWRTNKDAWEREERRYYGGDGVLEELKQFDQESTDSFEDRKSQAHYVNFPLAHVSAITGELSRKRPTLGKGLFLGGLGDVRPRDKITGGFLSNAELFKYNIDGVGQDGSEFEPWTDGVDERAQVTGHRWVMVESSTAAGKSLRLGDVVTKADVLSGQRSFAVEYSPLDVRNWFIDSGELQFAVIRVQTGKPKIENGTFTNTDSLGYYLLVRKGFQNLGPQFAGGGWWLFDTEKKLIDGGNAWTWDAGDIPMWIVYGMRAKVTRKEQPNLSKSMTMELGQIAVSLMNIESARDYDFIDACASRIFLLGGTPATIKHVADQVANRSIIIAVPPVEDSEGKHSPVTAFDGSTGAVAAQVSESIVKAKFEAAREQSFQQITSTPESSGESKKAGHAENKAPLLAKRARERQQFENTLIHFFEKRCGVPNPFGSSQWPTDFDLEPLTDAIDKAYDTLRKSKLRSKKAEVLMAMQSLEERGIVNDENKAAIQAELEASFDQQQATADAQTKMLELAGRGSPITET